MHTHVSVCLCKFSMYCHNVTFKVRKENDIEDEKEVGKKAAFEKVVWKTHFTVKVKYTSIFCTCYFSLFSLCIGRMCLIMMANAIWIKFKFMVWTFFPIAIACHRFNIFHPQSLIFFSSSSLLCMYNVQLEKVIKAKFVRKKETHAGSQAQEFS